MTKHFGDPLHYSNGMAGSLPRHTARAATFMKEPQRLPKPIYREDHGCKSQARACTTSGIHVLTKRTCLVRRACLDRREGWTSP